MSIKDYTGQDGGRIIINMKTREMNKLNPVILIIFVMLSGCSGVKPDLGLMNDGLIPCPKTPNCVNSQAADEEHYIQPIQYTGTQQEAIDRLLQILESEKRTKILIAQENYIRVEFTSTLFQFIDDVEFYFLEKQAGETIIHVRSASRIGYSDLSANRKRIEKIRSQF